MNIVIQYNQKTVIGLVVVVLIMGGIVWIVRTPSPQQSAPKPAETPAKALPSKPVVNDGINVDVSRVSQTGGETIFQIALNTHSGDLSTFDAATNVLFRPTNGSTTLPIKVGGDRETHHRTIEVTFKNLVSTGTLLINNLGSIKERSFEFK